ncbi:cache domain-containing protein [Acetatifactor muris]|uniref:Uncharacterized protein n=1 Tax=Acetatifactor muris TaxID=879566 RepID=A0A2K4ZCM2_9FIRM|nr:cache domain-containing protein [Acetatifactor muris]MCR2046612.1 cache domain-containing protein [Acetatifactor muris]SOY28202.1 hypothetical protein AMURIS_00909 [Acetatifactor muris]
MNIKKVKKDFMIILSVLFSVLITIGTLLIMSIMNSTSYQQLQAASNSIAIQTANGFDFAITQIWEQIDKTAIYDDELATLASQRYENSTSAREVYSRLRNIKLGSPYITAVYLYSREENRFLDADKGCSYLAEDFLDPMIHDAVSSSRHITSVTPHLVQFSTAEESILCYTLIVPLLHYSNHTGFSLCIQVNLDKLCADILNNGQNSGIELYICNNENIVLAALTRSAIGEKIEQLEKQFPEPSPLSLILGRKGIMWAGAWSENLSWHFYIQMPYEIKIPKIFNTYAILWLIFLVVLVITSMVYILLRFMMRPLQKAALELNEKHLKELLMDSYLNADAANDLQIFTDIFSRAIFAGNCHRQSAQFK